MSDDIALETAQIIWNWDGDLDGRPPVKVMAIGDKDEPNYFSSWGACHQEFNDADAEGKLLLLYRQFHWMVLVDGVEPEALHDALLVIPEYRASLYPDLDPLMRRGGRGNGGSRDG